MFTYILLFLNPIITLGTLALFFYYGQGLWYYLAIAIINILLTGRVLSRFYFWRFKLLWLNLIFVYIAQFLFLVLLSSDFWRYFLAILLSIVWGMIWWLLSRYFVSFKDVSSSKYLGENRFWYYLSFWFLTTSIYSLLVFLNFSLWLAILIILIATYTWSREILSPNPEFTHWQLALIVFIIAQVTIVIYFLPINFYVAGTIATLWFFFIIDNIISVKKHFSWYLYLFVASIALLLITAIF